MWLVFFKDHIISVLNSWKWFWVALLCGHPVGFDVFITTSSLNLFFITYKQLYSSYYRVIFLCQVYILSDLWQGMKVDRYLVLYELNCRRFLFKHISSIHIHNCVYLFTDLMSVKFMLFRKWAIHYIAWKCLSSTCALYLWLVVK